MSHVIEMLNIRKEFPGIVANDDITLQVEQGEIHAILGENGAGKSTLMSILFGLYHADKGQIKVKGKEVRINDPNDANELGIGMVHQHFQLVQNFTVTENIILGKEGGFFLDRRTASKKIKDLSVKYGLNIDPNMVIDDITVGMQQRVEILKMLYRNAEILIFDEPTAVLTPQEIEDLMGIMRSLVAEGKSVILITHKLNEIKAVADRCTVIRRGKVIGVVDVKDTSTAKMASMMVGRPVSFKVDKKPAQVGRVILDIHDLKVMNSKKVLGVKDFSLSVKAGEIVGIAGVDGNGQTELIEAITGLREVESGSIILDGNDITNADIRRRNEIGLGHIPEDRQKRGLVMSSTVFNNVAIKEYYHSPFSKRGILEAEYLREYAQKVVAQFDVRSGEGIFSLAGKLSGGNQQKLIVGREVVADPELLIAVQPTRGLDVGAIEYIHSQLVAHRDKGHAVLLVSFELDEIFNLSDRIAVMNSGELIDIVKTSETNEDEVGLMMAGVKQKEGEQ
ncbi:ABC transporter ATP-binding protein [Sphaerochaeta halotolerans]|jgi:simple sugar transport system ATP-binding protein|uniref:ABC transporter ATP-binding protein n=1 Tax=Sphaerochaeta halotolerans TaxID=2293840 RepID=UPI00136C459D|nr:ABC transporter ATP-binding protein [Sphaerochaeta halotolerans]MBG0767545.1 ABC transporter ATP-binding protein [Spirochaetaceae bacterium]MDK2859122.1 ral nucleoside transport system ATP-binding protein [Sphaerochaeta sp.]MDN5333609.1 ral nucleoside transport system ATP-binding protein [Sphaerochaeta sp.]MXI87276.1 ATP-binding cassette domain-containing protein [Sphaerochaeta halotolerans]